MRRIAALLLLTAALAVLQPTDEAAGAVRTFSPSADTYADRAKPNRSFGSAVRLHVRGGVRSTRNAYLRFTLPMLSDPVLRAVLRLYVTDGTPNGPAVYRTAAWPGSPLTWNRRPALVAGPRGDKGRLRGGRWVAWDVTPWVSGDGEVRFALKGGSTNAAAFMSDETSRKPQLVVTTGALPSTVEYVAPTQGVTVSGVTRVRVLAPAETNWIGVYACGKSYEDHVKDANGEWSVEWDTRTACSNGTQDIDTWAFRDGTALGNTAISVEVSNSSPPPPDPEPTPCPATPVPEPVAGQGYTLRFSDCFGTLSRSVWCSNQWWEPTPPQGTQYVAGGALHLVRRRSDGYVNVTVSTEPCGQANPQSFQYGYMEARMRYDTVRGNGPAFWMLSTRHATNPNFPAIHPFCAGPAPDAPCLTSELDIFEGFGNIQYGGSRTDDFFSGALHRNTGEFYGQPNVFRFRQRGTGLDLSQWHTYAALWTSSTVTYYVDGEPQGTPVSTFDSTQQPMHLLLYNWTTDWETENVPNAATPDELDVSVDWVRVWQQSP